MHADMYDILTAADDGEFRVTFGGDVMTDWEIRQQLLSDSRYVAIAIAIANHVGDQISIRVQQPLVL